METTVAMIKQEDERMKKQKIKLIALTLALSFALTACGGSSSSTTQSAPSASPEASVDSSAEPDVSDETTPADESGISDDTTISDDASVEDGVDGTWEADPEVPPAEENDGIVEDENSPAKKIQSQFEALMAKNKNIKVEKLAKKLISNTDIIPFAGDAMPVEPGYLNGFTEEITGFESGATFGPVIGSIPFVGYVFELSDDADVEAFMDTLESKSDLRWNICTEADERLCSSVDNYVFFIMAPAGFDSNE